MTDEILKVVFDCGVFLQDLHNEIRLPPNALGGSRRQNELNYIYSVHYC